MGSVHVFCFPPLPILSKGKGVKLFYPRSDLLYLNFLLKTLKIFILNISEIIFSDKCKIGLQANMSQCSPVKLGYKPTD